MNQALRDSVVAWIAGDPDGEDRATLQGLLDRDDEAELERRFAAPLTFGTAGLRGPVMAGPAGMNRCTVRRATQGVIMWMLERGVDTDRGVVGRDGRHGSEAFNNEVVHVLLGAGVRVFEMPGPLPTPLVAYCVKALGAEAGIMITASHNPPMDNGFKLYSSDGSQIIPPNDEIVEHYANVASTPQLAERPSSYHRWISDDLFVQYRNHFTERFGVDEDDLAIVYTPLHGVGGRHDDDAVQRRRSQSSNARRRAVRAGSGVSHASLSQSRRARRAGPGNADGRSRGRRPCDRQ